MMRILSCALHVRILGVPILGVPVQIEVIVGGLPSESFSTVEGKKEHFWEWRDDGPDDCRRKPERDGAADDDDADAGGARGAAALFDLCEAEPPHTRLQSPCT